MQHETRGIQRSDPWGHAAVALVAAAWALIVVATPWRAAEAQKKPSPSVGGGACPVGQVCATLITPDEEGPTVDISPLTSTVTQPSLTISIGWCDNSTLNSTSRVVTLDNVSLSSSYALSTKAGCVKFATSTVSLTLAPGAHVLRASISDNAGNNSGVYSASYTYNPVGPAVSLAPHSGDYRSPALCALACGDMVMSYSTPAYMSLDTPRSVTLVYRSGRASPTPVVQIDARDTTSAGAVKIGLLLKDSSGANVVLMYGGPEIVRTATAGQWTRLAVQVDARTWNTGAYNLTAVVTAYKGDGSTQVTNRPIRLLVENASRSVFGAGVGISGYQHVTWAGDGGIVVTDGSGEIAYFTLQATFGTRKVFGSPAGDFSSLVYYGDSAIVRRTYPDGTVMRFNAAGNQLTVQDRFASTTTFAYNSVGTLISITDPAGRVIALEYETASTGPWRQGSLRVIHTPGGRDSWVDIASATNNWQAILDPGGVHAFTADAYDSEHRVLTQLGRGDAGRWNYTYDFAGALATTSSPTIVADGSPQRLSTSIASLSRAVLVEPASGLGSNSAPAPALVSSSVRASVVNPRGNTTTVAFDKWGGATRVEQPLGRIAQVTRDDSARVTRTISPSADTVDFTWSGPDRMSAHDRYRNRWINYSYEPLYHELQSVTDGAAPVRNAWVNGHLDTTFTGTGDLQTRSVYEHDPKGRISKVGDGEGHWTTYYYAPAGWQNLDSVVAPVRRKTAYNYDSYGNLQSTIGPGGTTSVGRDVVGRVTSSTSADGGVTTFVYDAQSLTQVTDPKGQAYSFDRNALGWLVSDSGAATAPRRFYYYDRNGNTVSIVNRRGQSVSLTYDELDQPTSRTADGLVTKYHSDALGRFFVDSNSIAQDTVLFDLAGRDSVSIQWINGHRYVLLSTYDGRDRRTSVAAPMWGTAVRYGYDALDRLDSLISVDGAISMLSHDHDSFMSGYVLPNGVTASTPAAPLHLRSAEAFTGAIAGSLQAYLGANYAYGPRGELTDRTTPDGLTGREYRYDAAGRFQSTVDYTMQTGGCQWSEPDANGNKERVCSRTGKSYGDSTTRINYDLAGNRTDSSAVVLAGNRLIQFGGYAISYDLDGNVVAKTKVGCASNCTDSLVWNSLGQLTRVHRASVGWVDLGYDGAGRRVRKTWNVNDGGTLLNSAFLYDGADIFAELDAAGNPVIEYSFYPGVDHPHSMRQNGQMYYYHQDVTNNVVGVSKSDGTLDTYFRWLAFGTPDESQSFNSVTNRLGFKGREWDSEAGVYYMRARYYDPRLGRFLSEDPIGLDGGTNTYAFADNDPVNAGDPSGLIRCWINGENWGCGDDIPGGNGYSGITLYYWGTVSYYAFQPANFSTAQTPDPAPLSLGPLAAGVIPTGKLLGPPNGMRMFPKQIIRYGPDGIVETSYDFHRPHSGEPYPHANDWRRLPDGQVERIDQWRPVRPGELSSPWSPRTSLLRSLLGGLEELLMGMNSVPILMVNPCSMATPNPQLCAPNGA